MDKETELFNQGIEAFNNRSFYDAHEFWEKIWLEYKLKDADFNGDRIVNINDIIGMIDIILNG